MKVLKDGVYYVGAKDWTVRHFHGYELSTHKGSTYNAYLIKDEKTVLIDTVWAPLTDQFLENLNEVVDIKKIDYVVVNHAEPDHSGALPIIMEQVPNAQVIVSKRGLDSVKAHYHKDWNFKVVSTGDRINIGKEDLVFIEASMLHWPDSMFTYLTGKNILFSNDAFGQHFASLEIFSDEVDEAEVYQEAIKYYANILTPYSGFVKKKIDELKKLNLPIDMIAPSHGVIWRKNPMFIVDKYYEWACGKASNTAVIAYNSMWGATAKMAEYIGRGLDSVGISYKIFNAATADTNDIITEIFKARALLVGSSTVNNGVLVSLASLMEEAAGLRFIGKVGAAFGSYGWSGESTKVLTEFLEKAKIKVLMDGLKIKYVPDEAGLKKCVEFGKEFGEKLLKE